jgi:hypothetical protein
MTDTTEQGSEKTYDINDHQPNENEHVDAGENSNGGLDMGETAAQPDPDNADESGSTDDSDGDKS